MANQKRIKLRNLSAPNLGSSEETHEIPNMENVDINTLREAPTKYVFKGNTMTPLPPTPALQIAQILADLSDLNVAEPDAAIALATAHKTLDLQSTTSNSVANPNRNDSHADLQRMLSDSARESGMRLRFMGPKGPPSPASTTPSLSRQLSMSLGNGFNDELEPDLVRASILMNLYETRGRFKQQENNGLARARENVTKVRERYCKV